jgi:hypothetical protein
MWGPGQAPLLSNAELWDPPALELPMQHNVSPLAIRCFTHQSLPATQALTRLDR